MINEEVLFASGKIVIAGSKSENVLVEVAAMIGNILKPFKIK